jgi:D-3-phosphoglycerate dehydrogenase
MKIVVVDHVYLEAQHVARLRELGELEIFGDPPSSDDELRRRIQGAEIAIVGWSHLTRDIIQSAATLKMIAIWATSCHYADLEAAKERGIIVTHVPAYSTESVAEHAFALLLSAARRLRTADQHIRNGKFDWRPLGGVELAEKTLGLIGTGAIGFRVAEIAKAFKMRLLGFDKVHNMKRAEEVGLQFVDLHTLLKESDIVSAHVTLTPETTGMIGKNEINMMKRGAILINTSQGKVVDEKALVDALRSNHISYAGLDVFADEPPARDSPLFELANTVLSPHIGFHTAEAKMRCTDICIENVARFLAGQPQNVCGTS